MCAVHWDGSHTYTPTRTKMVWQFNFSYMKLCLYTFTWWQVYIFLIDLNIPNNLFVNGWSNWNNSISKGSNWVIFIPNIKLAKQALTLLLFILFYFIMSWSSPFQFSSFTLPHFQTFPFSKLFILFSFFPYSLLPILSFPKSLFLSFHLPILLVSILLPFLNLFFLIPILLKFLPSYSLFSLFSYPYPL